MAKKRHKMPTKAELLQLQKLYKTDEKIGERLGGVPAYLVAYWRRKKNIPKYSLPKFSEQEIRTLWERYGDDEKAGLELGISKAAFYNWRRRYNIRQKPAFLKLEQLEFNFPGSKPPSYAASLYGRRSMAQKIFARLAGKERVEVGESISIEPDLAVLPGRAGNVVEAFRDLGVEYVWNPNKIVLSLDHRATEKGTPYAETHQMLREFARRQGIRAFYGLREGNCHQLFVEKGHILPGRFSLGVSSRINAYGCLSSLSSVVDTDAMANVWATGTLDVEVPETARVQISGRRYRGTYASDVALFMLSQIGLDSLGGKVIEYGGSVVSQMSIGERFTLSHFSRRTGTPGTICQYDATCRRYLTGRTMVRYQPVLPDKDAEYQELYQISVDQLVPQISCSQKGGDVQPVAEIEGRTVNLVVLGGCTTGRFEDLRVAADILKGKAVHDDCRMVIIPGSRTVYLEALKKGLIRVFVESGAIVMSPSCYPGCLGSETPLAPGERCLSTTLLPFEGDETKQTEICLCSPATAAVSAVQGVITDPTRFVK